MVVHRSKVLKDLIEEFKELDIPTCSYHLKGALSRILADFCKAKIYICVEGNQKIIVHFH